MVAVAGTSIPGFVETRVTTVGAEAALVNVTVQVPEAPGKIVSGVQVSVVSPPGNTSATAAVRETDASDAVTTAFCATVNGPAVAAKVTVVAFDGTPTESGSARSSVLLRIDNAVPPAGAVLVRVAVHLVCAIGINVPGAH
jgi:hypothetical protein